MPTTLRCTNLNPHRNFQDQAGKARAIQMKQVGGPVHLDPLPAVKFMEKQTSLEEKLLPFGLEEKSSAELAATLPARVAWFPRGVANDQNNNSFMIGGIVRTNFAATGGGVKSWNSVSFGPVRKQPKDWQRDLVALRSRSMSSPSLS
eukprot:TRINITY_DN91193_c0_g1_i1.p1 TRINITY_DN91193_c0_g1~~TRINITY_DN91193_c0_g1_i1.p1  ORF type:complete len:158 (+),score=25.66 TRINITY_DN91193_c0_g1_i1:35-475(+)